MTSHWHDYCSSSGDLFSITLEAVYVDFTYQSFILETMMRFVRTFVPTLTIHRVHIGERTEEILSLQIEMEDGSLCLSKPIIGWIVNRSCIGVWLAEGR